MELRHLRYFTEVAEALNFSRAAARLHVTQPALSRQIRDLEEELGCRLLLRGANARTELTPEGRHLLAGAREVLAATEQLAAGIRARGARLRLGHYGALWLDYFTPALRRFRQRHPQVPLELVELTPRELAGALRTGGVNVALLGLADAAQRREFHVRELAALPAKLALPVAHRLAKRRKLRLAELRAEDWISWDEREFPGRKQVLVDACRAAGFRPRIVQETDSMASLFGQVATSGAIGHVIPMSSKMPHAGVVLVDLDPPTAIVSRLEAAWRRDELRKELVEALLAELVATR